MGAGHIDFTMEPARRLQEHRSGIQGARSQALRLEADLQRLPRPQKLAWGREAHAIAAPGETGRR